MSDKITNLDYLQDLSEGDEEFIKDMIETFIDTTPDLISQMKEQLNGKDFLGVGQTAHKIKPTITFMGISSLETLIREIEQDGKNNENIGSLTEKITILERNCELAYQELNQVLSTM